MTITKRDIIRAIHSDVVDWITNAKLNGGWYSLTNDTFTYASASTFTVDGDWTDIFQCGIKLRCLNTTQKYFYVVSAAYSAPNTTVTVTGGSDYTLASATISDLAITGCETPRGFPGVFNWTPVYTGFSADPTATVSRFWIIGKNCYFEHNEGTDGTSNADTFRITIPIVAATLANPPWGGMCAYAVDNTVALTTPARWAIASAGTYIGISKDAASALWTTSGGKRARVSGWYAIAA
jgi:hypothetical protein